MRLPRAAGRAALVATLGGGALLLAVPAGAHPGPVDNSGGHYCTAAQNASNLCAPPTYHRHDESGNQVVVTPGPEAAQLTSGQPAQPFDPANPATAPSTVPPATTPPPAVTPAPAPAPLAQTGPMSWSVAMFGAALAATGLAAVGLNRRMPLPVILELDRRPAS
jgi:hypothetical protein